MPSSLLPIEGLQPPAQLVGIAKLGRIYTWQTCIIALAVTGLRAHWPYGLIKSVFTVSLRLAFLSIGSLGLICGLGGCAFGQPTNPKDVKNAKVFAAAPLNRILTGGVTVTFSSLYAPPPYLKVTLTNFSPLVSSPSTGYSVFATVPWPPTTIWRSGGTTGTAPETATKPWANTDCGDVDVWFPQKNMTTAPSVNDPNATVTIRISPPLNDDSNCRTWRYHYDQKEIQRLPRLLHTIVAFTGSDISVVQSKRTELAAVIGAVHSPVIEMAKQNDLLVGLKNDSSHILGDWKRFSTGKVIIPRWKDAARVVRVFGNVSPLDLAHRVWSYGNVFIDLIANCGGLSKVRVVESPEQLSVFVRDDVVLRREGCSMSPNIWPLIGSEVGYSDAKLAEIDKGRNDSDRRQNRVCTKQPFLQIGYGFGLLALGFIVGLFSHSCLLWSGYSHWRLRRRLVLGFSGWAVAIFVLCQGMSLLINLRKCP